MSICQKNFVEAAFKRSSSTLELSITFLCWKIKAETLARRRKAHICLEIGNNFHDLCVDERRSLVRKRFQLLTQIKNATAATRATPKANCAKQQQQMHSYD